MKHQDREPSVAVAVAVVSFNTRELLLRCLTSLEVDVRSGLADVWVVDNGSSDGSVDAAREAAPWARVIDANENLGFGRAVNLVAERTQSPWVAAANADVAAEPGALAALVKSGERAGVGCVAPRLVLPTRVSQHSAYPFPTIPFTAAFNLGVFKLSRKLRRRLCLEDDWDPDEPRFVPWAIGAFLLLRREAFDAVGGFDARQWMYAEDLELGWRLHDAGWRTWYEPSAHVKHDASAATSAAFGGQKTAVFMEATYAALARRRGVVRTRITGLINIAGAGARVALAAPLAPLSQAAMARREEGRRWLYAHRRGLSSALERGGSDVSRRPERPDGGGQ